MTKMNCMIVLSCIICCLYVAHSAKRIETYYGKKIFFSGGKTTQRQAKAICELKGGQLTSIEDRDYRKFLENKLSDEPHYIGLQRDETCSGVNDCRRKMYWLDGLIGGNKYWSQSYEPHDYDECVVLNPQGKIRGLGCHNEEYFICIIPANACQQYCMNGATCITSTSDLELSCTCADGFTGTRCNINVDECGRNPCQAGQICEDLRNGYRCRDIELCMSIPCGNGGECIEEGTGYTCNCNGTGFQGTNCSQNIDECEQDNICLNDGVCVDTVGSFECHCNNTDFTGTFCDEALPQPRKKESKKDRSQSSLTGSLSLYIGIGGGILLLVLIIVTVVVVRFYRKRAGTDDSKGNAMLETPATADRKVENDYATEEKVEIFATCGDFERDAIPAPTEVGQEHYSNAEAIKEHRGLVRHNRREMPLPSEYIDRANVDYYLAKQGEELHPNTDHPPKIIPRKHDSTDEVYIYEQGVNGEQYYEPVDKPEEGSGERTGQNSENQPTFSKHEDGEMYEDVDQPKKENYKVMMERNVEGNLGGNEQDEYLVPDLNKQPTSSEQDEYLVPDLNKQPSNETDEAYLVPENENEYVDHGPINKTTAENPIYANNIGKRRKYAGHLGEEGNESGRPIVDDQEVYVNLAYS